MHFAHTVYCVFHKMLTVDIYFHSVNQLVFIMDVDCILCKEGI